MNNTANFYGLHKQKSTSIVTYSFLVHYLIPHLFITTFSLPFKLHFPYIVHPKKFAETYQRQPILNYFNYETKNFTSTSSPNHFYFF